MLPRLGKLNDCVCECIFSRVDKVFPGLRRIEQLWYQNFPYLVLMCLFSGVVDNIFPGLKRIEQLGYQNYPMFSLRVPIFSGRQDGYWTRDN